MRRVFWVAVGAAAGVYAVRKVQKTMHAYSPSGLAEKAGGLGESLKGFAAEVRERAAERESELRDALGLTEDSALSPAEAAELTDHPAQPRTTSARSATAATDPRSTR
ncbi:MAG TPA: DUF6167 family protein [Nonomuraea sp.]|nr:DUF6167 family protein [Nonomuraea sp.]